MASSTMDVSESLSNVMAAASCTPAAVTVALHPLVVMNISEHWTRNKAQQGSAVQVVGALIGKQKGRDIEVTNSFELKFEVINGDIIIDREYYNTKEEQFKQVFSDLDFLGWYTTGAAANDSDLKVHRQICEINESPLFLKLNPFVRGTELPVTIYESVIDLVSDVATMLFIELPYTLATEEAERIGVDHVARMSVTTESSETSSVGLHLAAQHSAVKMLHSRAQLIVQYLEAVNSGQLKKNHEILREIYALCHRLPVLRTPGFKSDFYNQCNDVALMTYLATMTKGCQAINQLVNRFNCLYDRHGSGRRVRGLFL